MVIRWLKGISLWRWPVATARAIDHYQIDTQALQYRLHPGTRHPLPTRNAELHIGQS